jgi:G:T-mismatch repair DNA endonuclease (very short patch repair protein)
MKSKNKSNNNLNGRTLTEEHKNKISLANKGKVRSKETKEKLKKRPQHFNINHVPWNKGIKVGIKPTNAFKKGDIPWNKGRIGYKSSKESIEKFKKWRKTQINLVKDTSIEIKIQSFLSLLHLEYFTHRYIAEINHGYQCDIFIPIQEGIKKKTIIECDGCYWHGCPLCKKKVNDKILYQIEKDNTRNIELINKGYKVIRLWEHNIKKMEIEYLKSLLLEVKE